MTSNLQELPDYYDAMKNQMLRVLGEASDDGGWMVSRDLWDYLWTHVKPGMHTFETGCGVSTWLFAMLGGTHVALEHSPHWYLKCKSDFAQEAQVLLRPLVERDGHTWYSWEGPTKKTFDLILVDGPPGEFGREGILDHIESLASEDATIIVDDTHRLRERELARDIGILFQKPVKFLDSFGVICCGSTA